MQLVVIESPFAGLRDRNVAYARACMRHSLMLGEAPLASHMLYPQVLDDDDPEQRKLGITAGFEWGRYAHLVAFYTDLGWSPGMEKAWDHWRTVRCGPLLENRSVFLQGQRWVPSLGSRKLARTIVSISDCFVLYVYDGDSTLHHVTMPIWKQWFLDYRCELAFTTTKETPCTS